MAAEYVQLHTTIDDRGRAQELVRRVLDARLAACGQIVGPLESTYWWKGRLEHQTEWSCVFKTRADLVGRLTDLIGKIHPYETPKIAAFEMDTVSRDFGDWMEDETDE